MGFRDQMKVIEDGARRTGAQAGSGSGTDLSETNDDIVQVHDALINLIGNIGVFLGYNQLRMRVAGMTATSNGPGESLSEFIGSNSVGVDLDTIMSITISVSGPTAIGFYSSSTSLQMDKGDSYTINRTVIPIDRDTINEIHLDMNGGSTNISVVVEYTHDPSTD